MSETNWIDVIPSVMSAVATVAAAVAAFGSLRVSQESKEVSRLRKKGDGGIIKSPTVTTG